MGDPGSHIDSTPERPRLIAEVEPIEGDVVLHPDRAELEDLVELPLRQAALRLYDMGIETLWSTANGRSIAEREYGVTGLNAQARTIGKVPAVEYDWPVAALVIDFDSLNEANRSLALEHHPVYEMLSIGAPFNRAVLWWHPIGPETTIVEVETASLSFANSFADQVQASD